MGIFKKKEETQKSKAQQLAEMFNSLTDEELEEFLELTDLDGDGDVDENDVETEEVEGATENTEQVTTESTTEETEEPIEEEPTEEITEEETAQTQETEAPTEEAPQEPEIEPESEPKEEIGTDKFQALQSQIDSLKETIEGLVARIEADKENTEEEQEPFGIGMQNTGKEADGKSDVQKAKEKYWAF